MEGEGVGDPLRLDMDGGAVVGSDEAEATITVREHRASLTNCVCSVGFIQRSVLATIDKPVPVWSTSTTSPVAGFSISLNERDPPNKRKSSKDRRCGF
jgi:hypothetical protein